MITSPYLPIVLYEPLVRGGAYLDGNLASRIDGMSIGASAFGDYDTLKIALKGRSWYAEDWLDLGLYRHIEIYNPALDIIFEGFVNAVTVNVGSLSITRGPLLQMANKIRVVYSTIDTTTETPLAGIRTATAWASDTTSQALYGIIEKVISVGGASATNAEGIRNVYLAELKDPTTTEQDNLTAQSVPSVNIECLSYLHYLNTFTHADTTTGTVTADAKIEDILQDDPNSVLSTDYTDLDSNALAVPAWENDDPPALSAIKGVMAKGDTSTNRWIFGFGPGRKAFYNVIPSTNEYTRRLSDPNPAVRNAGLGKIDPWDVDPAQWVFYTDFLIAKQHPDLLTTIRGDLRYMFIEQAAFSAPTNLVMTGSRVSNLNQILAQMGLGGMSG